MNKPIRVVMCRTLALTIGLAAPWFAQLAFAQGKQTTPTKKVMTQAEAKNRYDKYCFIIGTVEDMPSPMCDGCGPGGDGSGGITNQAKLAAKKASPTPQASGDLGPGEWTDNDPIQKKAKIFTKWHGKAKYVGARRFDTCDEAEKWLGGSDGMEFTKVYSHSIMIEALQKR